MSNDNFPGWDEWFHTPMHETADNCKTTEEIMKDFGRIMPMTLKDVHEDMARDMHEEFKSKERKKQRAKRKEQKEMTGCIIEFLNQ